jgi:hypothetical protein
MTEREQAIYPMPALGGRDALLALQFQGYSCRSQIDIALWH